tara:strand:+ start:60 stop:557 length:498 start_codon:yes stop_codon:yes gene_type:complete
MAKHISNKEQKFIKENLPDVDLILTRSEDEGDYKKIVVSVFDHWMTREEFITYDDVDYETLMDRRKKFEKSIIKLYNSTQCYLWKYKRHYRVFIYKPTSLEQILNKCNVKNQTYKTGTQYDILMPECSAVYTSEGDWTNIIWYMDKKKIQPLIQCVKEAGLHILE